MSEFKCMGSQITCTHDGTNLHNADRQKKYFVLGVKSENQSLFVNSLEYWWHPA